MYIIFDTETTGLPNNYNAPISDIENWNRCVQLAWQVHDIKGDLLEVKNFIIKPDGYSIPYNSSKIHGITTDRANKQGMPLDFVLNEFNKDLEKCNYIIGHNINFDINIVGAEFYRCGIVPSKVFESALSDLEKIKELKILDDDKKLITDKALISKKQSEILDLEGRYNLKSSSYPSHTIDTVGNWDLIEYDVKSSSYTGSRLLRPNLTKLYNSLFHEGFAEAHNASADVEVTTRCFFELIRTNDKFISHWSLSSEAVNFIRENNTSTIELIGLNIEPYKAADLEEEEANISNENTIKFSNIDLSKHQYSHIHNHTSYSILGATTKVDTLIEKALSLKMPAVGITDLGNMYGAYVFVESINKINKDAEEHNKKIDLGEINEEKKPTIVGIVGSEFFIAEEYKKLKFTKDSPDRKFTQVLLAKNKTGYHNIAKLSSIGNIDGLYAGYPRIGKELLLQHKEGVIALTGSLTAEIPSLILNSSEKKAEEAFKWWLDIYGDDFYIELIRHGLDEENVVNETLLKFAEKYDVKYIAQNDTYYPEVKDADTHDTLLCIKGGNKKATEIGRGRNFRFGFPNDQFYFKTQEEMKKLFSDIPQSIINIKELVDKIEPFTLSQPVLLPEFDIPKEFLDPLDKEDSGKRGENAYLKHITYQGAKKRYGEITDTIKERIDFELKTIERTGYPGYFLIVQDITTQAQKMGVIVGPGRGSAAGSVVAYCTFITNIDPLKYDLLFERFLNPDRVSLPDIDIDFDNEGRQKIIDFVVDKYGKNKVAQIITYGTMAAKSAIRDAGRSLDLPLSEVNKIAKLMPDIKLAKLFSLDDKELKAKLNNADAVNNANELKKIAKGNDLAAQVINQAKILEGSVRNTGIHACGVIITPTNIRDVVPVGVAKDSNSLVTQFDNNVVESAGLLKMDFLGLKTLTIIKDAVEIVKKRNDIDIIPNEFSLEDKKTYELFQRGETIGLFQYESVGMQKHLINLKPTNFDDLIAMNALYRPGPMEYIPKFINRKHGREEIIYDIDVSKKYLKETYGITVYQEQVMLLSQLLANFTKGEADTLRKAMGKKIFYLLEKMKPKFLDGCEANGHNRSVAEKIWKDWEAFASYAFNKSHSTCYAYIGFQTAYLKAHYPAEYMASVLSNNMNDIKSVTFFMEECKRMNIEVLGPDVNESEYSFTVNKKGNIRFGMGAVKGVGEGAVDAIISERNKNGSYSSIFDLAKRIDLHHANKRAFENLAVAGGFDSFPDVHRAQYLQTDNKGEQFISKAIKYGNLIQQEKKSHQRSLFGDDADAQIPEPTVPKCESWGTLERLNREKEVVGLYISGHPLSDYSIEIEHFTNTNISDFSNMSNLRNKSIKFAGIVSNAQHLTSRKGHGFGKFMLSDFSNNHEFMMFGEEYMRHRHMLINDAFLYIKASVISRYGNDANLNVKWSSIELLSDVLEKNTNKILISILLSSITKNTIDKLKRIITSNKGNKQVEFKVINDSETNIALNLYSASNKVNITSDFIREITSIENLNYKLV